MERDWTFTLTNAGQVYNLWYDLILPTITDRTFGNSPYVPGMVAELETQNQTAGANITRRTSTTGGFQLSSGSWDINRSMSNIIDLKRYNFVTDTGGAVLYVQVIAR